MSEHSRDNGTSRDELRQDKEKPVTPQSIDLEEGIPASARRGNDKRGRSRIRTEEKTYRIPKGDGREAATTER
jgi:hypothetical protein